MDTTVCPPPAPVPFPPQFPNNGSPRAVAMLIFGRFTSNNIVSCSVHCLQCIIRLPDDVPLASGALHGHYSWPTHHSGPFSSTIFVYCVLQSCRNVEFGMFRRSQRQKTEPTHTHTPHRQPCTRVLIDGNSTCTTFPTPLDPFNTFRVILPTHAEPPQYRNSTCLTSKTVMFKVIVPFNLIYQIVYPPTHPLLRCTISRLALSHNMSKSCGLLRRKNVTFRRHERQIFILLVSGSTRLFVLQTRGSMAT